VLRSVLGQDTEHGLDRRGGRAISNGNCPKSRLRSVPTLPEDWAVRPPNRRDRHGGPTTNPGKYRDRVLPESEQKNLLKSWTRRGVIPTNIAKVHVFKEDFDQVASFQALLNHVGRPTVLFKPAWRDKILSHVHTKTHNWLIGGVVDLPLDEFRPTRIGDAAVAKLKAMTAIEDPFFLRVSFHSPHVGCFVPPSHLIDPATIDLPLPSKAELAAKPKFERENLHIYSSAPHLTPDEIGLARGTYYGMVSLVDDQVGRIVDVLKKSGRLNDTIIVINSDQGFQLGEHGNWKKRDFYDTNVCVPFIVRAPGQLPAKVVDEPVEMIDLVPTLMELCGMQPPTDIRGRSLIPLIQGDTSTARQACFSEHDHSEDVYDELRNGGSRRVMVRTKEWKLVFFMDERASDKDGALYHLVSDPYEKRNLYNQSEHKEIVAELMDMADQWDREA